MRKELKKQNIMIAIIALLLVVTIGYATLQTNLTINGTSKINNSTWNVHFNNPSAATTGSVAIDTNTYANAKAATKDSATSVSYNVLLSEPGDFYEFIVPVQNEGTIDAMIDTITSTIKIGTGNVTTINSSSDLPEWLSYSVTCSDGVAIAAKHKLDAGTTETYKVRVEFKRDITNAQFSNAVGKELQLTFSVDYVQKDNTAVTRPVPLFGDDSWDTIISNVQNGTIPSYYTVGSTKTVDMGTFGTHTLRIANTSTPAECSTTGFSQTACGFVLEFVDIITDYIWNTTSTSYSTTEGGWPASKIRTYINNDIYNEIPSIIRNSIVDTYVVSGHEYNKSSNYSSTDKLYLLSQFEITGRDINYCSDLPCDSADALYTRHIDYYNISGVNGNSNSHTPAIKNLNDTPSNWWLRSIDSNSVVAANHISNLGYNSSIYSNYSYGISPAFRIR